MVKTELYISDNQMELKPNTVIALTLQIYDLAEMKNYQVNFTNKFSIPKTAGNKKKLGFAGEISSTERAPYKLHDARVITGGIEIVPDGFAIIKETTKDFEIVIYTGLLDLFEKLDGLTLHDLSTLPNYDHDWSLVDAAGSITNTTGYIYPAIQYGAVSAANNNLDIRYSYPSFYINTLITDILADQGYTKEGDILTDDLYEGLVLPFSKRKWEHSDRYIQERGFNNQIAQTLIFGDFGQATATDDLEYIIQMQPLTAFTSPGGSTLDANISITISDLSKLEQGGDQVTVKVALYKITAAGVGSVVQSTSMGSNGSYTVSSSGISLAAGDTLQAALVCDYVSVSGNQIYWSLKITSCNFFTDPIDKAINLNDEVLPEAYLPKLNQKTFLKAIGQMFGVIFQVDPRKKVVKFRQIKEIRQNLHKSLDWSDKLAKPKTPNPAQWYVSKKTVISGAYGQQSYLRYKADETVTDQGYDGYFDINDQTIPLKKTLFTLPFAASDTSFSLSPQKYLASIPYWEDDGAGGFQEVQDKPQQRIGYIHRANGTVVYKDGTSTSTQTLDLPYCSFNDPNQPKNLDFSSLMAQNYTELRDILTDSVKLSALLRLNSVDILNFDPFVPVYIDRFAAYFYVNKISNYVEGKVSTVELIKIG